MPPRQRPSPPSAPVPPPRRGARPPLAGWLLPLALLAAVLLARLVGTGGAPTVPYSTFLRQLDSGVVTRVTVGERLLRVERTTADPARRAQYVTVRVDPALVGELQRRGVPFAGEPGTPWLESLLLWVAPLVLVAAFWSLLLRRAPGEQPGGVLGFGRSGARVYAERGVRVTFNDVAGVDEAKAELREVVAFLRDPAAFGRLGAHVPRGVLLVGPPGTGKTLLARAVAGEADVPFFTINGSEFVELFVGVGAARVRDLFRQARQNAPCIVFIDEIDALGRTRGAATVTGANDEKEQTLNQLLAELDGFTPDSRVILLAATNRPEILDAALLRAGRFDRQVLVDRPDRAGRVQVLRVHVRRTPLAQGLDLDAVAALTPGFTGADLANLVNEAALAATRRGADAVGLDDFTVAVERIVAGLAKKSRVLSPRERGIAATHEMGHALVARATPGADPVHKVSIIPHGMGALGFTLQRPAEERYLATAAELEARLAVLLGGRAAELVALGESSTGAGDDLAKATDLARDMVTRHGMAESVGPVAYEGPGAPFLPGDGRWPLAPRAVSEATQRDIEQAVRALVDRALARAVRVLRLNRAALDEGVRRLLAAETLTPEGLPAVVPLPAGQEAAGPEAVGPEAVGQAVDADGAASVHQGRGA
ncbi:MAG: ATP-dependent zinc metalloprotease FtsH [Gemmatimonadetes bacterium]|nr:ATP-dependent zinc metalloprotease FtsH [Gemmatimonadota bacterium]